MLGFDDEESFSMGSCGTGGGFIRDASGSVTDSSTKDGARLGLGLFIMAGIIVSYAPQFSKIMRMRSSKGISAEFLLIGCTGGAASLANIVLLQADTVSCCFTDWSPLVCLENTLGLTQVFVQVTCFGIFLVLSIAYFPRPRVATATAILPDPRQPSSTPPPLTFPTTSSATITAPAPVGPGAENSDDGIDDADDEATDSTRGGRAYIRALKIVNLIILVLLAVTLLTAVVLYTSHVGGDDEAGTRRRTQVAGVFGLLSAGSSLVLFTPQIIKTVQMKSAGALSVPTLVMQVPGNFLFAFSLSLSPGANITSWGPLVISGLLQFVLLALCLHYSKTVRPASGTSSGDREPLLH
ncbi:hypothetical protein BC830DRAFT_1102112 [Chytriomyces sp. MP71]|nr:hypothetical protein BC830DRAFT_1102112 [Chytriomyces sp. MP71]